MLDPIHGQINLDQLTLELIDTQRMQRLRRIKQLGLSYLVYPGANHTRFEHSLGVMHLAEKVVSNIESLDPNQKKEIKVAALLHDVGHGPLSHLTEEIVEEYTTKKHEDIKDILKEDEISKILEKYSLSLENIADHIKGKTSIGQILSSEVDVDRMDYLVRDAHYTGVNYGNIDFDGLINHLQFQGEKLVLGVGGLKAAESLLISRFWMNISVYSHHITRIAETMGKSAIECMIERNELDPLELRNMDDVDLIASMRKSTSYARELVKRLDERKLYKRALYLGFDITGEKVLKFRNKIKGVETKIAEIAGVDPLHVLMHIPDMPKISEMKALIKTDQGTYHLNEISHFVSILEKAHKDNWRMGIFCPVEDCKAVEKASREFFGIKNTRQYKLTELYK